ncbi:MAG TPA: transcription elongation factor GreA [Candidatus Paceibacterota bacterium]|nr:transcription elongation factor GreA [Candidatus Paceibacterota bacterium]HMP18859.1 transcription elongation factor GreA [Candidatus Paceibacterota bacterium]HMP85177.1 transcription elongation factor GreA [Candidatus Paceibacterota bacterium]
MSKEYLSKEKYQQLQQELQDLTTVKRKEVADRLEYARSLGDLSENAEYHAARDEQGEMEARIEELSNLLKNAEIIHHKKTDSVIVGSVVTLQKEKETDFVKYQIVGSEETDLSSGKISYNSPLGNAILGKKKDEKFSFDTPKGSVKYTVINIQ